MLRANAAHGAAPPWVTTVGKRAASFAEAIEQAIEDVCAGIRRVEPELGVRRRCRLTKAGVTLVGRSAPK